MKYLLLLLVAFNVVAAEIYATIESIKGQDYLYVTNYDNFTAYCYITSYSGHYEFTVEPAESSRRYPVSGGYEWGCD